MINKMDLAKLPRDQRIEFVKRLGQKNFLRLQHSYEFQLRESQRAPVNHFPLLRSHLSPKDLKRNWVLKPGRSAGKTHAATKTVHEARRNGIETILLSGLSSTEIHGALIKGRSGLETTCPPWDPFKNTGRRELIWPPNPAEGMDWETVVVMRSLDDPEQFRGVTVEFGVIDEFSKVRERAQEAARYNINMAVREPSRRHPHWDPWIMWTMTPRTTKEVRKLFEDPSSVLTGGSTFDNPYLPQSWLDQMLQDYGGTPLGDQELYGKLLTATPNSIFTEEMIEDTRARWDWSDEEGHFVLMRQDHSLRNSLGQLTGGWIRAAPIVRKIVGIDPSEGKEDGDAIGIVTAYMDAEHHVYIVEQHEERGVPQHWLEVVANQYHIRHDCSLAILEKNKGMNAYNEGFAARNMALGLVFAGAGHGKSVRADDVRVAMCRGKVHFAAAPTTWAPTTYDEKMARVSLVPLERELTTWQIGQPSPNLMDSLVWCVLELLFPQARIQEEVTTYTHYKPTPDPRLSRSAHYS